MSNRQPRSRTVSPNHIHQVRQVWDRYGATQEDFALELEIATSTFGKFLNGKPVSKEIFDKICDTLKLNLEEISISTSELPEGLDLSSPPFITGNPIDDPRCFFGREREIKRIFQLLNRRPLQNVAIVGNKRIGKTSLLHYLRNITQTPKDRLRPNQGNDWLTSPSNYRWVFVDFQNPHLQHKNSLIRYILNSLKIPVNEPCTGEYFMEVMPQYLDRPTVILFDEIATVLKPPSELDDRFWESFRSLASNYANGNLAYILTSPISPVDLAKNNGYSSPFFNIFGYTANLGAFTQNEAMELIASAPQPFDDSDIQWILEQSRCLPLLLQKICCERLFSLELEEDGDWQTAALVQIAPFDRETPT
jgi:hypothetical protein